MTVDCNGSWKLLASHWLLVGQRPTLDEVPCRIPFETRAAAAAKAGYAGVGFSEIELRHVVARYGMVGLSEILAANGLFHIELEALSNWWVDDDAWRRSLDWMVSAAAELGAPIVKAVGAFGSDPLLPEAMTEPFSRVVERVKGSGVRIAMEIIAFSNLSSIESAMVVLGDSAGKDAALMLDSWHFARAGLAIEPIADLPANLVAGVEISDVAPQVQGQLFEDTVDHRLPPTCGVYDLEAFMTCVRRTGFKGPIGLEVLSEAMRGMPIEAALGACSAFARRLPALSTH